MPLDKKKIVPRVFKRPIKTPEERRVFALIKAIQKKSNGKPRTLYVDED